MRFVDARLGRIDDDEHFCRKIAGFAVENHARHFDLIQHAAVARPIKMKPGKPVLAVDDEEAGLGIFQIPNRLVLT